MFFYLAEAPFAGLLTAGLPEDYVRVFLSSIFVSNIFAAFSKRVVFLISFVQCAVISFFFVFVFLLFALLLSYRPHTHFFCTYVYTRTHHMSGAFSGDVLGLA